MTRAVACRIVTILFVVVLACSGSAEAAVGAPARGPGNVAIISVQGIPQRAQSAAASGGSPTCFRSGAETNCVSGNPDLSVGFASNGDTTGCTFDLEIQWDDGGTTSDSVNGGPDGTPFGPYDHTYTEPGIYTVDWSSTVTANTGLNNCDDSSGAYSFTYFPCLQEGQTSGVTLPAITERAGPVKGLSAFISYGKLPLTFTSVAPTADSVCTVRSNEGSMPVSIFGATVHGTTTATVEFLPANDPSTQVPACTFAGLQGLANVTVTPPAGAIDAANNCLLTSSAHDPNGVIARWSSPGFTYLGGMKTDPLTYYIDLSGLGGPAWSTASFSDTLQAVEAYTHITLVDNLPMIDKLVAFIDPPASLSVTDPQGQTVGVNGGKAKTFPGSGYFTKGKDSVAWIIEPAPGSYSVTASGPAGASFMTDAVVVQFLGHGKDPLMGVTTWKGKLGRHGTATSKLGVKGSSLAPVIIAHESKTRAKIKATIKFNLNGSSIPFSPATIAWSFGDGTTAKGSSVSHAYKKKGKYTPSAKVTNSIGDVVTVKLPTITITA